MHGGSGTNDKSLDLLSRRDSNESTLFVADFVALRRFRTFSPFRSLLEHGPQIRNRARQFLQGGKLIDQPDAYGRINVAQNRSRKKDALLVSRNFRSGRHH